MRILRLLLVAVALAAFSIPVSAQQARTEYYRLIKRVAPGGDSELYSENAGQFVTRRNGYCYDSDKNGRNAGNGQLSLYDTRGAQSAYRGASFWDRDSRYRFDDNRGMLNVKTSTGEVYVFRRETPPQGRNWPSFVQDPGFLDGTYQAMEAQFQKELDSAMGVGKSHTTTTTRTSDGRTISSRPNKCPSCFGRGRCSLCSGHGDYQPSHTSSHRTRCPKCDRTGRCTLCHGSGYYGRTVWYNRR